MSFSLKNVQADAESISIEVERAMGHSREERILDMLRNALRSIAEEIGGFVSVSAAGHINEDEGLPGDSISLSVSSLPKPGSDTPAAAPVTPPEASVAAPQTADGSPNAVQQPVPQGAIGVHDPDPGVVTATDHQSGSDPAPPAVVGEPSQPQQPAADVIAAQTGAQGPVAPPAGTVAASADPSAPTATPGEVVNETPAPETPASGEPAVAPVESQSVVAGASPVQGTPGESTPTQESSTPAPTEPSAPAPAPEPPASSSSW